MARTELDVLLDKVDDVVLRTELKSQIERLNAKRTFGLVFESHLPERVRLPEHPIRRGVKVTHRDGTDGPTFDVLDVSGGTATIRKVRNPDGTSLPPDEAAGIRDETTAIGSLVVMADFGEPVYPGLRHLGSIDRGGNKPDHVVIKGENHHVLEMLQFTHAGKVDCIYLDPPYNSGARDWKYNNDFVDKEDDYKHSKWLAFMERRLRLARALLNPEDSVLIVTIDEKEVHRLALLLQQTFQGSKTQMVSTLTNPKGVARGQEFYRVDEYIIFVFIGAASVTKTHDPMILTGDNTDEAPSDGNDTKPVRWGNLLRSGTDAKRSDRQRQFYPIFLDAESGALHSIGEPLLPVTAPRSQVEAPPGTVAVWPIRKDNSEGRWQVQPDTLRDLFKKGYASIGRFSGSSRVSFSYVTEDIQARIASGDVEIIGRNESGTVILRNAADAQATRNPKTIWNKASHSASEYGTTLMRAVLPGREFPFPKSLYAVEDTIRFFVKEKRDAIVLDFFAGSGTTAHAVMRLNRQDNGCRQTILVTNNEVSYKEQTQLRKDGLRPGDADWERLGIYDYITKPRVEAAITGSTPEGDPISGEYRFTDPFPIAEGFEANAEFFELTYLDPDDVELDLAFSSVAPLLWLRAGGRGPLIADRRMQDGGLKVWDMTDQYGVLFNPDHWRSFVKKLPSSARAAFVITDSQATFTGVAAELPGSLDVVRLYENYMTTFAINQGH